MPVPNCLDYCGFVVILPFEDCFGYSGSFVVHMNFRTIWSHSLKNAVGILIGIELNL